MKKLSSDKCLFPDCPHPAHVRGLCRNHYITAARLVRMGRTTWEKLEKTGKAYASQKPDNSDWFLQD